MKGSQKRSQILKLPNQNTGRQTVQKSRPNSDKLPNLAALTAKQAAAKLCPVVGKVAPIWIAEKNKMAAG